MIEDALDSVKTTRYQVDSFSHLSEEVEQAVDGLRAWTEKMEAFFADPSRAAAVAASIIFLAVLVSYLRARLALLSRRSKKKYF
ncbi:MAG: hypothetical protein A2Y75_02625 [Candidatus Solincola sediminis]|uniref:Uncharacterized protein n=1 Tax=Candidatus Solincola sediminis TaxID=1797199 RepID=A0A1F2WJM6_9ACTN|nr:MAG: hypothetical protein A2Y75_02625 [Candidatus Solincola sediminis]